MILKLVLSVALFGLFMGSTRADTPANCTYEDVRGLWVFHEGPRGNDKTINCSSKGSNLTLIKIINDIKSRKKLL